MIEIFRGAYLEAMNFRNLLENSNISVYVENEYMSSIRPWSLSAGGYAPSVLKVEEENYIEALEIMDSYNNGEFSLDIVDPA